MKELSVFVDESGELGSESRRYLVALVLHDQANEVGDQVARYRMALQASGLPVKTFHLGPLLNGHDEYEGLPPGVRKQYLSKFMVFVQHMPFKYTVFAYKKSEFKDAGELTARIRRDITVFLFDQLSLFQGFDKVKLYYDGGQDALARVLDEALRYVISNDALIEKDATTDRYMLLQIADFVCGLELERIKFEKHEDTATDRLFFSTGSNLKRAYLKKLGKKRIER